VTLDGYTFGYDRAYHPRRERLKHGVFGARLLARGLHSPAPELDETSHPNRR